MASFGWCTRTCNKFCVYQFVHGHFVFQDDRNAMFTIEFESTCVSILPYGVRVTEARVHKLVVQISACPEVGLSLAPISPVCYIVDGNALGFY